MLKIILLLEILGKACSIKSFSESALPEEHEIIKINKI
jgi:hypothetical protein